MLLPAPDNKSLFGSFSSEKEQDSSFSEEKEAKRLLCLVPLDVACQAMETVLHHQETLVEPSLFAFFLKTTEDSVVFSSIGA